MFNLKKWGLLLLKGKLLPWKTNFKKIEIEITTACNLRCYYCDRSVRQAPSNERMSTEQITKFVKQSLDNNWEWKRIRLIGGEPTLHPQLHEIIEIIKGYRKIYPRCRVELCTNGCGDFVNKALSKIPPWIFIKNSLKTSDANYHKTYNIAPIDTEEYKNSDFTKGCWITQLCGLGLTRYGFYACGAGAGVDRVFGLDIGIKDLSKVNEESLRKQKMILCSICGHFKGSDWRNKSSEEVSKDIFSKIWKKAYENYKQNKPKLSLY